MSNDSLLEKYLETDEPDYYAPATMRYDVGLLLDLAEDIEDLSFVFCAYRTVWRVAWRTFGVTTYWGVDDKEVNDLRSQFDAVKSRFDKYPNDRLVVSNATKLLYKLLQRCLRDIESVR
jgi:hypothetical protein